LPQCWRSDAAAQDSQTTRCGRQTAASLSVPLPWRSVSDLLFSDRQNQSISFLERTATRIRQSGRKTDKRQCRNTTTTTTTTTVTAKKAKITIVNYEKVCSPR